MGGQRGAGIGRGGGTRIVKSGMSPGLVLLSLSDCSFTILWPSLAFVTDPFSLFHGLDLLRQVSVLWEEVQQLEMDGLQKVQLAMQDWRQRVFMGSRGELYHIPPRPLPHPTQKIPPCPHHHHIQAAP